MFATFVMAAFGGESYIWKPWTRRSRTQASATLHEYVEHPCSYRKPKQLTDTGESVDSSIDERSLQFDLVHLDRAVPIACCVGSRNPGAAASAQRSAAQLSEAGSPQQHRPAVTCWALSPGPWGAGRSEDHKAGDVAALAPRRVPSLLALEIPIARRSAVDTGRHSPSDPRNEHRKPALGCAPDTRGTAQTWHRCRTDHGCKVYGEETATAVAGLEDLPAQSRRRHRIDGSVLGPNNLVSAVVWIADPAARSSRTSMGGRHGASDRGMDCSPTDRGIRMAADAALHHSRP